MRATKRTGSYPAARRKRDRRVSGLDGVAALAVVALGGRHDLLAHYAGQESGLQTKSPTKSPPSEVRRETAPLWSSSSQRSLLAPYRRLITARLSSGESSMAPLSASPAKAGVNPVA